MSDKTSTGTPSAKIPKRVTISPTKFVLLSIITVGFYHAYWGWRVWETVRRSKNEKYTFKSSLRGWFLYISNFLLLPQLYELASKKGYKTKLNLTLTALIYALIFLVGNNQQSSFVIFLICILATTTILLPIVSMHNYYVVATKAEFTPSNTNWWLIGALSIGLTIFALFFDIVA